MPEDDRSIRLLSKQLEMLNRHVAKEKISLGSLRLEKDPKILLRDGSTHSFRKDELEKLAAMVPLGEREKLMLPIYIEISPAKYGKGTSRVAGRLECMVVSKILQRECTGDVFFVYKPELRILRRELPTSTQYVFTLAE